MAMSMFVRLATSDRSDPNAYVPSPDERKEENLLSETESSVSEGSALAISSTGSSAAKRLQARSSFRTFPSLPSNRLRSPTEATRSRTSPILSRSSSRARRDEILWVPTNSTGTARVRAPDEMTYMSSPGAMTVSCECSGGAWSSASSYRVRTASANETPVWSAIFPEATDFALTNDPDPGVETVKYASPSCVPSCFPRLASSHSIPYHTLVEVGGTAP